jgi:hypothetical protein
MSQASRCCKLGLTSFQLSCFEVLDDILVMNIYQREHAYDDIQPVLVPQHVVHYHDVSITLQPGLITSSQCRSSPGAFTRPTITVRRLIFLSAHFHTLISHTPART